MHRRTTWVALCLLGGAAAAPAEIYRCVIDGRTTFRDKPCPAEERQSTVTNPAQAFAGCYAIDYAGWESGHRTELMRVAGASGGHYTMATLGDASTHPAILEMRRATPAELRDARRLLKFEARDGIVMIVPAGTPNMPALPIGLYKRRDEYRDIRYFFFGYMANGWAKPVPCPPAQ